MGLCREWAKEMGFGNLDSNGARTKTHIHQMLQRYGTAKDLENQSGTGTIRVKRKVEGQWKVVELTLLEQQIEKCPTFKILNPVFGEKHANCPKNGMGIGENDFTNTQQDKSQSQSQEIEDNASYEEIDKSEIEGSITVRHPSTSQPKPSRETKSLFIPTRSPSIDSDHLIDPNLRYSQPEREQLEDEPLTPVSKAPKRRSSTQDQIDSDILDSDDMVKLPVPPRYKKPRKSTLTTKTDPIQGLLGFLGQDQQNQKDRIRVAQMKYEAKLIENSKEVLEAKREEAEKVAGLEERKVKTAELMARIE